MANRDLRESSAYRQCQQNLLKQEIINKKRRGRLVKKDLSSVKNELMFKLKWIDFHHVCNLFLVGNDRSISKHQNIQDKKICRLSNSVVGDVSHDPEQVILNFSSHILTEAEKSVLFRGLQFALPPQTLEYADYMVSFELIYRDIKTINLNTLQNKTIKSTLLDTAFSSFDTFKKNKPKYNNLSEIELQALNSLLQNKDITIQKADKGSTIVVIDKDAYKKKMKAIISDGSKFELDIQEEKHLNFILNKEKRLREIIKPLHEKGCFIKSEFLKICPTGSKPGILYGEAKVHKPAEDNFPSFHLILSAIGTPTYDLAKFLVPILKPLTEDEYTVHDSFSFASEVSKFNAKNLMVSLDFGSLFTNIPLEETIDNIINDLYLTTDKVHNFEREELKQLLSFAAYESFFIFDEEHYTQIDGVAIASILGPTLANAFLCHFEKNWLSECPAEFLPGVYKRYVNGIFVSFNSYSQLLKFVDYMNHQHPNIKFAFEVEKNNNFSFLDVKICRENNKYTTSMFRKPTFSGVFTNIVLYLYHTNMV